MAELVQKHMEQMLTEMEQLQRVKLFTADETRTILKKRKAFEYKLRKKTPNKADYCQYIEYEQNLLTLIWKRREKEDYPFKKCDIDTAIVTRIHRLFRVLCRRFKEDQDVWLGHIMFCQMMKEKVSVSQLYAELLRIHNKKPELWIRAAKWEVEDCQSMENARSLLHTGLRFNKLSHSLWIECFRFELLNAQKLRARREVLGLANMDEEEDTSKESVLKGKIAETIYKSMTQVFPDNVDLLLKLLEVCSSFEFADWLEDDIYTRLQEEHRSSELAWDAVAKRYLGVIPQMIDSGFPQRRIAKVARCAEEECCRVYHDALQVLNTEKMWNFYLKTCFEIVYYYGAEDKTSVTRVLNACEEASTKKLVSEEMYFQWLTVLVRVGAEEDHIKRVLGMAVTTYPGTFLIWQAMFSYMAAILTSSHELCQLLQSAASKLSAQGLVCLWEFVVEYCRVFSPEDVRPVLENGLTQTTEVANFCKSYYVEWAALHEGLMATRALYDRFVVSGPLTVDFIRKYVDLEKSQLKVDVPHLRDVLEAAIQSFGCDQPDVWIEYITLELRFGEAHKVGHLHWRALTTLQQRHVDTFKHMYSQIHST